MCEKPVVKSTLLDIYYTRCLSGPGRTPPGGRWIKTWIFLIFMSLHSKIFPEIVLVATGGTLKCSVKMVAVRSIFARRCAGAWDSAHLTRPLCLFAALRPLWLVNDDVLSQQTISLLNTSFSLLVPPPTPSWGVFSLHPSRRRVRLVAST